jgi:LemA protein
LSKAISGLLLTVENYPQLKSHEPFQELMKQLSEIEDDLQKSRRYYNGTVRELNTQIESIPSNVVAMLFGFHQEPFFTLERLSEQQVPHIQWSSNS